MPPPLSAASIHSRRRPCIGHSRPAPTRSPTRARTPGSATGNTPARGHPHRPDHRPATRRAPRPHLERHQPRHRNRRHPPHTATRHRQRPGAAPDEERALRPTHPLPAATVQVLREHRERQEADFQAAGRIWAPEGYVFTAPGSTLPIEPSTLNRRFATLLRQAGLRRIRFHDLRHSTATLLLDQGVELVVIKELLGHAHIGVTATVYAHVRLRIQRDAINRLSTALAGTTAETATNQHEREDPPGNGIMNP
ncbi:tyrosine-type recombinase/integrase [Streptacidiphilus monticola]